MIGQCHLQDNVAHGKSGFSHVVQTLTTVNSGQTRPATLLVWHLLSLEGRIRPGVSYYEEQWLP